MSELIGTRASPRHRVASRGLLGRRSATGWRWDFALVFPLMALVLFIGFTALGLSGSSVGVLGGHADVIAGTHRPIRSDEWNIETPFIVAQSHHGFVTTPREGVGSHNFNVILNLPTRNWTVAFKPWNYGLFALDIVHGFAFRWWMLSVVLLLGCYSLLVRLTRNVLAAALFSVAFWASPFFQWWYEPETLASVGMAMVAVSAFLASFDTPHAWRRKGLLGLSAWATVSWALVLYPPFQIATAIVMVFVVLADLITWPLDRARAGRIGKSIAAVGVPAAVVLGVFYLENKSVIHVIANTVYPGRRTTSGGTLSLTQLLSAPFGYKIAAHGLGALVGTNQSEIASFVLLGPFALLLIMRRRVSAWPRFQRRVTIGLVCAYLLLAVWYLIGLPTPLATVVGLNRVPVSRSIGGLGVAGFLLAVVASSVPSRLDPQGGEEGRVAALGKRDVSVGAALAAFAAFVTVYWSGVYFATTFPGLHIGWHYSLAVACVIALIVLFIGLGMASTAGLVYCAIAVCIGLTANPLTRGLGPLVDVSDTGLFTTVPGSGAGVWLSYVNGPVVDVLVASGVPTFNAVSIYPDIGAWKTLDPTGRYRDVWDRYANVTVVQADVGSPTKMLLNQPDSLTVSVDPCSSGLRRLGVRFIVTGSAESRSCLSFVRSGRLLGQVVDIYRVAG